MVRVLDGLLELHRIDQELRDVEREIERLPAALTASEQELAGLQEKKAGLQEEARGRQVAADKSNVQIRDLEGRIEKYQIQLNIAKTQKEYDTLRHEVSTCQEQISEIETGALTAYEEADQLTSRAGELAPRIAEVERSLESQRAEMDDRLADLAHRREKLERGRAEHVKAIDEDDLKLYERVRSKHRDGALTRVENGVCTICNVKLTPQSYNLVLLGEQLQQCRSCGRLCYSEDAPGTG